MKTEPTLLGYLNFLQESKVVYDCIEDIVSKNDEYSQFRDTGLERSKALATDILWLSEKYGLPIKESSQDSPGSAYARLLSDLAVSDPPAFICHYYNTYFAHTAGGRMIGAKVSQQLLDDAKLEFYKYEVEDVKQLLEPVRENINRVATQWSREEKDACLQETENSFKMAGKLLRLIVEAEE